MHELTEPFTKTCNVWCSSYIKRTAEILDSVRFSLRNQMLLISKNYLICSVIHKLNRINIYIHVLRSHDRKSVRNLFRNSGCYPYKQWIYYYRLNLIHRISYLCTCLSEQLNFWEIRIRLWREKRLTWKLL